MVTNGAAYIMAGYRLQPAKAAAAATLIGKAWDGFGFDQGLFGWGLDCE